MWGRLDLSRRHTVVVSCTQHARQAALVSALEFVPSHRCSQPRLTVAFCSFTRTPRVFMPRSSM